MQASRYGGQGEQRLTCFQAHIIGVRRTHMLYYALLFLLIALVAGFLGFGGIAFAAAGIAKLLFYIFVVLFIVSLVMHLARGARV